MMKTYKAGNPDKNEKRKQDHSRACFSLRRDYAYICKALSVWQDLFLEQKNNYDSTLVLEAKYPEYVYELIQSL